MEQIEMVDKCLSYLIKVGLYKSTSRELSLATGLNKSGLYYHFKSKDDVVLACAERAISLITDEIMLPTIQDVIESNFDVNSFSSKAQKFSPMMNFLIQVYSETIYREKMVSSFSKANECYQRYAERIATSAGYDIKRLEPYIRVCITTITNFLIFSDTGYLRPQFDLILSGIEKCKNIKRVHSL